MSTESLALREILADICNSPDVPSDTRLICLSDLDSGEAAAFNLGWQQAGPQRQREVVGRLVELARGNIDLNFDIIFRCGLASTDAEVRAQSITGLKECEDYTLIGTLGDLARSDKSERVRRLAAEALGRFGQLVELGKLRSTHGEAVYGALLAVLEDHEEEVPVKTEALEAIAVFGTPRVVQLIKQAYDGENPAMKLASVLAMGHTCQPEWVPALTHEMSSQVPELRAAAARAAGEIGVEEAVPRLIRLTRDETIEVREAAINALGEIGGDVGKRVLQDLARSGTKRVREAAQAALKELLFWEDPGANRPSWG